MRRKRNLDERADNAYPYLLKADTTCVDARIAVEDKHYVDLSDFDESKPLELELGCGKGKYAIEYATTHPEINYLAVEKLTNVIVVGAEETKEKAIPNLRFLCSGAEYLPRFLKEKTVSRIHINFPCPFHKETYYEKRLTSKRYLEIYDKFLTEDGEIELKTDNQRMFAYSIEQMSEYGFVLSEVTLDLHNSKYNENNIKTEYEQRYTEQGLPIFHLKARRRK